MCGSVPFARHVALRYWALLDRPDRLARHSVKDVEEGLLGRRRHCLDATAVHVNVSKDRRRGDIVILDRMMHDLEMPLPLPGFQVYANQALAEKVVAGAVPAVEIGRRRLY